MKTCAICKKRLKVVDDIFYLEKCFIQIRANKVECFHSKCLKDNPKRIKKGGFLVVPRTWQGEKSLLEQGVSLHSKMYAT